MKDYFSAGRKNAQYRSPKIQNELIAAVGKWIQQKLTQEIKATKLFTVCADEGTDVANKEQLPLHKISIPIWYDLRRILRVCAL